MKTLPINNFFDSFYIWFNKDKKEQYYATPLYMHNTNKTIDIDAKTTKLFIQQYAFDGLKYPGNIVFPFVENFGMMLIMFLNADLSTFDTAYYSFFYAYGFELIKEYIPYNQLQSTYKIKKEMLKAMKETYVNSYYDLSDLQYNYKSCIDDLYNLNDNNNLKDYSANSKFIAGIIKHKYNIPTYSTDMEVFLDNYTKKSNDFYDFSYENLVDGLESQKLDVKKQHVYSSNKLSSILYLILEELVQINNLPIKQCQNCGKYFIPTSRQDEIYCEFPDSNGKSCKEKGASLTYKKNLENIPALLEYRRSYQKKIMIVSRNKDDKQLKKDFDNWKKNSQAKIKLFKQGKLDEDTLYKWIIENK